MKIVNILKSVSLALVAISTMSFAQEASKVPVYIELSTGSDVLNDTIQGASTATVIAPSYKINDRYTLAPELITTVQYRDGGANKFDVTHSVLRVNLSDKRLAKIGDKWLAMTYRYVLPTTIGAQRAGNLGALMFRPAMSWDPAEGVKITARNGITVNLLRNAYQTNPAAGSAAKGNTLLSNNFEVWGEITFLKDFYFQPYYSFGNAYVLGGPNGGATSWANKVLQEYEVGYASAHTFDTTIAMGVDVIVNYGPGKTDKVFNKDAEFYLKLGRVF
jgi:hypothetical protein